MLMSAPTKVKHSEKKRRRIIKTTIKPIKSKNDCFITSISRLKRSLALRKYKVLMTPQKIMKKLAREERLSSRIFACS
jgi:hypothetical protein